MISGVGEGRWSRAVRLSQGREAEGRRQSRQVENASPNRLRASSPMPGPGPRPKCAGTGSLVRSEANLTALGLNTAADGPAESAP